MDIKLFRNATLYVNRASRPITLDDLSGLSAQPTEDPTGSLWVAAGFAEVSPGEYAIDVNGGALYAMLQINQRILPAAVIKEHMAARIHEIEARDQRKASKAEWAQVRDEVEGALLHKAFIKRKYIPILFVNRQGAQYVFIHASSAKVADTVATCLAAMLHTKSNWQPARLDGIVAHDIGGALTLMARGEQVVDDDGGQGDCELTFHNSAVLLGGEKQKISVKDKDIASADVQTLLKQEYKVIKLGLSFTDDPISEPCAQFVLNDSLVVSGLVMDGVKKGDGDESDQADAFFNNVWVTARTLADIAHTIICYMGGLRERATGSQVQDAKNADANSSLEVGAAQKQTDFEESEF